MFKQLLKLFTEKFIQRVGRKPQTTAEFMSIQDDAVRYLNKTKGVPEGLPKPPFQGFTPKVIEGGKSKKGIGTLFKDSPEAIAKMKADNKAAVERLKKEKMEEDRAKMEDRALEDYTDDYTDDPEGLASGGLARVGMVMGGSVWKKFIEGLFIKTSNNIRQGKGKWKGLNQDQWMKQHDDLTKMLKKWEMSGKKGLPEGAEQFIGMNDLQVTKAIKDAEKQVLSKPKKTLEGLESKGTIDISDPEVADEFSRFIKESDPKGYKDLEQKIKLSEADFDVTKGLDDLENIRGTKASEIMTIKLKYPGISDDLIRNIMVDDNPQRKAEVFATLDEAFKMMEKGKGEDEIIKIFKNTSRTKQASGGIAGQLHLNQGGRARFQTGGDATRPNVEGGSIVYDLGNGYKVYKSSEGFEIVDPQGVYTSLGSNTYSDGSPRTLEHLFEDGVIMRRAGDTTASTPVAGEALGTDLEGIGMTEVAGDKGLYDVLNEAASLDKIAALEASYNQGKDLPTATGIISDARHQTSLSQLRDTIAKNLAFNPDKPGAISKTVGGIGALGAGVINELGQLVTKPSEAIEDLKSNWQGVTKTPYGQTPEQTYSSVTANYQPQQTTEQIARASQYGDSRMQAAADKGMDARMGRTYAENKQVMADPRMLQASGGLANILGV